MNTVSCGDFEMRVILHPKYRIYLISLEPRLSLQPLRLSKYGWPEKNIRRSMIKNLANILTIWHYARDWWKEATQRHARNMKIVWLVPCHTYGVSQLNVLKNASRKARNGSKPKLVPADSKVVIYKINLPLHQKTAVFGALCISMNTKEYTLLKTRGFKLSWERLWDISVHLWFEHFSPAFHTWVIMKALYRKNAKSLGRPRHCFFPSFARKEKWTWAKKLIVSGDFFICC